MRYPACLQLPYVENTFLGVPISQTWNDLALWEAFLDDHPIASLLELGTWKGGMALFLGHQGKQRGFHVHTVDCHSAWLECGKELESLSVGVHTVDVFSNEGARRVDSILREMPRPRLLFCDNGNKALEWATFVPKLEPGDYVVVHDWMTEFRPEHCIPLAEPIWHDWCDEAKSMTRFFRAGA
jgi:cephalosporin hydroxylase